MAPAVSQEECPVNPSQKIGETCRNLRDALEQLVSKELDVTTAAAVEAHVRRCAACAAFVDGRRNVRAALKSALASDADAPPQLLEQVRARLREASGQKETLASGDVASLRAVTGSSGRRTLWQPFAMAAGVLLAAAGTGAIAWMGSGWIRGEATIQQTPVAHVGTHFAEDVAHHGRCLHEMAGRVPPAGVVAGARKVDPDVSSVAEAVREQAVGGMTIVDAHRCTDGVRRYVHVVLELEGAFASVLVSPSDGDVGPGGAGTVTGTAAAAAFTVHGRTVAVVSGIAAFDAVDMAERIRPSLTGRLG